MSKFLYLQIENCEECPYCHYDSYYDGKEDSGYDCAKEHKRIVNDNSNGKVTDGLPVWCPLPEDRRKQPRPSPRTINELATR